MPRKSYRFGRQIFVHEVPLACGMWQSSHVHLKGGDANGPAVHRRGVVLASAIAVAASQLRRHVLAGAEPCAAERF